MERSCSDPDQISPETLPTYEFSEGRFRITYFAPGGYATADTRASSYARVPLTPPPEPQYALPFEEPPTDVSAYLVTQTPSPSAGTVQPAPPAGSLPTLDPTLAGIFLTRAEPDPRVPRGVAWACLEEPGVLTPASRLLNQVVQNWTSGGRPLKPEELLAMARDIVDDIPTALLLCHNVTRAFAHYSIALRWHLLDPLRAEYTDGSSIYIAKSMHADGYLGPPENPIFFALFAGGDLTTREPSRWARHFAIAVATAFAASSRLARKEALVTKFTLAFTHALETSAKPMVDRAQDPKPEYRAWLWANALSFVELAGLERSEAELVTAGRADLRACVFGLMQVGAIHDESWRWYTPASGTRVIPSAGQFSTPPLVMNPAVELRDSQDDQKGLL